jgi:regulator of sigma E protease
MNYLLAFVLFSVVMYAVGKPVYSSAIGDVATGQPAEKAGLLAGDIIRSVDGVKVSEWIGMADQIHKKVESEVLIGYERKGVLAKAKMKTKRGTDPVTGKAIGLIGIAPDQTKPSYQEAGGLESIKFGAGQCYYWTAYTVNTLVSNFKRREKPDLSGPIGIITIVSKAAHNGLADLFFLIALISVAVGFFNLLPIPLLDGGHALLFIAEGLTGRRLTPKIMNWVNSAGIAFLLCILLFATYNDIIRFLPSSSAPAKTERPAGK